MTIPPYKQFGAGRGHQDGFSDHNPLLTASHVIGYRTWGPSMAGVPLTGMTIQEYKWKDGTNTASCFRNKNAMQSNEKLSKLHDEGTIPIRECGCGFWAYSDHRESIGSDTRLIGAVFGWGKVIAGPNGFRSQYAMIVAIHIPSRARSDLADELVGMYPSVRIFTDMFKMKLAYAPTDLSRLAGEP